MISAKIVFFFRIVNIEVVPVIAGGRHGERPVVTKADFIGISSFVFRIGPLIVVGIRQADVPGLSVRFFTDGLDGTRAGVDQEGNIGILLIDFL